MALIPTKNFAAPVETPLTFAAKRPQAVPYSGVTICCDVSGSMSELMPDGKTRWQSLQGALQDIWSIGTRLISYSSEARDCVSPAGLPQPGGGTHLMLAIELSLRLPPKEIIVISDGADGDEGGAMRAAEKITCPIHALYVGEEGDTRAVGFLNRLCGAHRGTVSVHDLRKLIGGCTARALIGGAIRGLLEHKP